MKKGFTLAEVLITLGIIGVVAALTIPTLINNYNKNITLTRMKAFYSTMSQAFQLSETENGNIKNWEWPENNNIQSTKDWYERYLSKYIQNVKTEDTEKGYVIYYKNGSAARINTSGNYVHFIFAKKATEIKTASSKNVAAYIFGISQSACPQFETYRCKFNEIEELKYDSTYGCYNKDADSNSLCARLIQKNGWKFPDDYPWGY